ncbi:MAG: oligosaccharide flippase family protein [Acetobacteraceae bacterium]|nr:oligosaccharide flippase family protein [Acetobacteraceae bacterium]
MQTGRGPVAWLGVLASPATAGGRLREWLTQRTGGFARQVLVLLSGAVAGQAISVLLSPALTRLYNPDEFGWLSVYAAALYLLYAIASLRYEMALPITSDDDAGSNLLALCFLALVGTTFALTLICWWFPTPWFAAIGLGALSAYRYLLPLGFAITGAYYVLVYLATRQSAYSLLARTRISQGLSGPLSQIALGLAGCGKIGLAIGFIIGQSSGTLLLARKLLLQPAGILKRISWGGILAAAHAYRDFPLYSSWAALLEAAGCGLILFPLVTHFYASDIAGFIFLSDRVVGRPLTIVSASLLQVFVGEAGVAVRTAPAQVRRRFHQVVSRMAVLVAAWVLLANIMAAALFGPLFGASWEAAVPYLHALSFGYWGAAVLHPVQHTLQLLERQRIAAAWQVIRLLMVLLAVLGAVHLGWNAASALWAYSVAQGAACGAMVVIIDRCILQLQRQRAV